MRRIMLMPLLLLAMSAVQGSQVVSLNGTEEELDEVTVSGKRLYQMRADIIAAEDRFFAAYNELNQDDQYDVHCVTEAPLGTRLKQRNCRPVFLERAQEAEARAFVAELSGSTDFAIPAGLVAVTKQDDYRKNMLNVINANPRLRRLIREHAALEQSYRAEQKKRMKGRLILAD